MGFAMTPWAWWRDWRERRSALTEMKQLQRHDEAVLMDQSQNPLHLAKLCLTAGNLEECARRWEQACASTPNAVLRSTDSLEILLALQRYDEAENLAERRLKLLPGDSFALMGLARVAEARGDIDEALRRWTVVRRRVKDNIEGYIGCARCLAVLGQFDAAETQLNRALRYVPDAHGALVALGRLNDQRQNWAKSVTVWRHLAEDLGDGLAFALAGKAMLELGQIDEAEVYLKEPSLIYTHDLELAITRCHLAERRGDITAACSRWEAVRAINPLFPPGYHEGARCLSQANRHADADMVLAAAIVKFPDQVWPLRDFARAAHNRMDWNEAASRWSALRQQFPDDTEAYALEVEALRAAGRVDEATALRHD